MNDLPIIDGLGVMPVVRPASVAELGDVVRAADERSPLYPVGGRTLIGLGNRPTKLGTIVDVRGLDQVIDFPARDMTITVQAGITIGKLQRLLASENLRLPIDVPLRETATLGGTLAANTCGHRRFGYGTLRDYVIGISAVNDEGAEFKAGGRVVKNVAGYDICKLLVGSLGTLGIISQVTLKLKPRAEEQAITCLPCQASEIAGLLDKTLASRTRPVMLDVVNRAGGQVLYANGGGSQPHDAVLVGYEGNADAVKWQMQQLVRELGASVPMDARIGFTGASLDEALTEWPAWPEATVTLKASLPSSGVAAFLQTIETLGSEPRLRAHAGNGIVVGHYAGDLSLETASRLVAGWRRAATAVVVVKCAAEWKPALNVWGPPPPDVDMMRQVKLRFDPRNVFNPGRFVV